MNVQCYTLGTEWDDEDGCYVGKMFETVPGPNAFVKYEDYAELQRKIQPDTPIKVGGLYYDGDWQTKKGTHLLFRVLAIAGGYVMTQRNVAEGMRCAPGYIPLLMAEVGWTEYDPNVVVK